MSQILNNPLIKKKHFIIQNIIPIILYFYFGVNHDHLFMRSTFRNIKKLIKTPKWVLMFAADCSLKHERLQGAQSRSLTSPNFLKLKWNSVNEANPIRPDGRLSHGGQWVSTVTYTPPGWIDKQHCFIQTHSTAGVEKEDYTDLSTCQLSVRRHQGNWLKVLLKEKPSGLRCSSLDARVAHDWTVTLTVEQKRRLWRARARPLTCTHAHTHTQTHTQSL